MDIRMPVLDGIAATEKLHAGDDPLNVLVLTTFGEDEVLWGQSRPARPGSCSRTVRPRI
jgi:DNA-binding NarL/FixJ family response regulator